MPIKINHHIVR